MTRFVVVVDTQWDFMAAHGALSVSGAAELIMPMQTWLATLEPGETAGVLFTYDTHDPDVYARSPEAEAFPVHCVRGSAGWANVLDLGTIDPAIPTWTIEKGVFNMWAEEKLEIFDGRDPTAFPVDRETFFNHLRSQGVEDVTVIGVAADYCVRWAIEGLVSRGFKVDVPAGLTRGIERQIDAVATQEFAKGSVNTSS